MRFIELFAGIGGFRLGLEKASVKIQQSKQKGQVWENSNKLSRRRCSRSIKGGDRQPEKFHCVWANEWEWEAQKKAYIKENGNLKGFSRSDAHIIYRKRFGEINEQDIRTVDYSTIPEFDMLTAGFPCQSFSIAGKRKGFKDTKGTLFYEIAKLVKARKPKILLLENVKGLLSDDNGSTFETILRVLGKLGYSVEWEVLNSKNFGVPQNRERVFIIGYLGGFGRRQVFPIGESGRISNKKNEREQREGQRICSTIDSRYGALRNAAEGLGGKTGLYAVKLGNSNMRGDRFKKEGTFTVEARGQGIIQGKRIRRLTSKECERLQGFPDNWTKGISDTQRYKCLGNAVTVNVIQAIGKKIYEQYIH